MRSKRLFAPKTDRAIDADKYEWPGVLSPHQRVFPEQVSKWVDQAGRSWVEGLLLLFAIARKGQQMLDSGKISSLVLPWIDKFFISSRRLSDANYLERLLQFVSEHIAQPLILLWDDTSRSRAPSLGLAIENSRGRGLPFRGIGRFNTNTSIHGSFGSERAKAVGIIINDFPGEKLFALRPVENHCPDAFRRIFHNSDMEFFLNYDSSWKDNLAFLYSGTQVFPLLSVQMEMEHVPPWIFTGRRRYAFGAWFRRILRNMLLGNLEEIHDPLCLKYWSWANLL